MSASQDVLEPTSFIGFYGVSLCAEYAMLAMMDKAYTLLNKERMNSPSGCGPNRGERKALLVQLSAGNAEGRLR